MKGTGNGVARDAANGMANGEGNPLHGARSPVHNVHGALREAGGRG